MKLAIESAIYLALLLPSPGTAGQPMLADLEAAAELDSPSAESTLILDLATALREQNCNLPDVELNPFFTNFTNSVFCKNEKIKEEEIRMAQKAALIRQSQSGYRPVLSSGVGAIYDKQIRSGPYQDSKVRGYNGNVSIQYRIFDFGGRAAKIAEAESSLRAQSFAYLVTVSDEIRESLKKLSRYYYWQTVESDTSKYAKSLEFLRTKEISLKEKGVESAVSLLQIRNKELEVQNRIDEARSTQAVIINDLNLISNVSFIYSNLKSYFSCLNNIAIDPTDVAANSSFAFKAKKMRIEEVRSQLDKLDADQLPTLDAGAAVYYNGRPNQSAVGASGREVAATLSLVIPLYDGGLYNGKRTELEATVSMERTSANSILSEIEKNKKALALQQQNLKAKLLRQRDLLLNSSKLTQSLSRRFDANLVSLYQMTLGVDDERRIAEEIARTEADLREIVIDSYALKAQLGMLIRQCR